MAIGLRELRKKLAELLGDVDPRDLETLRARISDFYQYALENYDALDDEAKTSIDKTWEGLRAQIHAAVQAMRDGPEKRQIVRHLGIAEGIHFPADGLLGILESPTQLIEPVISAARSVSLKLLQGTLDVLFDVTRHTHKGAATFAKIGLFYWAIDELLAALHLAQRAFTNQAYAHIRTVFEILDKIELFHVQPKWAELWVSGEDREAWNELKPSEVRKKLGEPKFDPIYSFFSELGPHGTFKGLQARGARIGEVEGRKKFKIWVGGSPIEHHIIWTNSYCVYASLATLAKCTKVFEEYVNVEEASRVLNASAEVTADFFREHYAAWAKRAGLDPKPLIDWLDAKPWKQGPGRSNP